MNSSELPPSRHVRHVARDLLRDPALWAWLAVVLLAILPARSVLAG